MNELKKYSYQDWWEGRVILIYACDYPSDNLEFDWDKFTLPLANKLNLTHNKHLPIIVDYDSFTEEVALSIEQKQREMFNDAVSKLFETYTVDFKEKHSISKMPEILQQREIEQCESIMFEEVPNSSIVQLLHWNLSFRRTFLEDVQGIINHKINNGQDADWP